MSKGHDVRDRRLSIDGARGARAFTSGGASGAVNQGEVGLVGQKHGGAILHRAATLGTEGQPLPPPSRVSSSGETSGRSLPALVPQEHGGALYAGGVPGHTGANHHTTATRSVRHCAQRSKVNWKGSSGICGRTYKQRGTHFAVL